jgi:phosphatidylinositol 4-kinase type 2
MYTLFNRPLPPKIGSFQLFVKGFTDASSATLTPLFTIPSHHTHNPPTHSPSSAALLDGTGGISGADGRGRGGGEGATEAFMKGFERLVVLDYLIRNTDRGMDNWLVRVENGPNGVARVDVEDEEGDGGDGEARADNKAGGGKVWKVPRPFEAPVRVAVSAT